MQYWLMKSEPNVWSINQQKKAGARGITWDGVRNYQARNNSFSSPVTGSVAPIHHTPWASAMDDSQKTFLNQSKN